MTLANVNLKKALYKFAAIGLTIASILYLIREWSTAVHAPGLEIRNYSISGLAISLVAGLVHLLVMARIFSGLVGNGQNSHNSFVFLATQITKYVPGRVWPLVMQRTLIGTSLTLKKLIAVNIVLAWITLGGLVAGATLMVLFLSFGLIVGVSGAILCCLLFTTPITAFRLLKRWLAKYEWANITLKLTELRIFSYCVAAWVTSALSWFTFYSCALGYGFSDTVSLYGVTGLSIVAGMASVLPAGLGLREAAILWTGDVFTGWTTSQLASIAIEARVWLFTLDTLVSLLGFVAIFILALHRNGFRGHRVS